MSPAGARNRISARNPGSIHDGPMPRHGMRVGWTAVLFPGASCCQSPAACAIGCRHGLVIGDRPDFFPMGGFPMMSPRGGAPLFLVA